MVSLARESCFATENNNKPKDVARSKAEQGRWGGNVSGECEKLPFVYFARKRMEACNRRENLCVWDKSSRRLDEKMNMGAEEKKRGRNRAAGDSLSGGRALRKAGKVNNIPNRV